MVDELLALGERRASHDVKMLRVVDRKRGECLDYFGAAVRGDLIEPIEKEGVRVLLKALQGRFRRRIIERPRTEQCTGECPRRLRFVAECGCQVTKAKVQMGPFRALLAEPVEKLRLAYTRLANDQLHPWRAQPLHRKERIL